MADSIDLLSMDSATCTESLNSVESQQDESQSLSTLAGSRQNTPAGDNVSIDRSTLSEGFAAAVDLIRYGDFSGFHLGEVPDQTQHGSPTDIDLGMFSEVNQKEHKTVGKRLVNFLRKCVAKARKPPSKPDKKLNWNSVDKSQYQLLSPI